MAGLRQLLPSSKVSPKESHEVPFQPVETTRKHHKLPPSKTAISASPQWTVSSDSWRTSDSLQKPHVCTRLRSQLQMRGKKPAARLENDKVAKTSSCKEPPCAWSSPPSLFSRDDSDDLPVAVQRTSAHKFKSAPCAVSTSSALHCPPIDSDDKLVAVQRHSSRKNTPRALPTSLSLHCPPSDSDDRPVAVQRNSSRKNTPRAVPTSLSLLCPLSDPDEKLEAVTRKKSRKDTPRPSSFPLPASCAAPKPLDRSPGIQAPAAHLEIVPEAPDKEQLSAETASTRFSMRKSAADIDAEFQDLFSEYVTPSSVTGKAEERLGSKQSLGTALDFTMKVLPGLCQKDHGGGSNGASYTEKTSYTDKIARQEDVKQTLASVEEVKQTLASGISHDMDKEVAGGVEPDAVQGKAYSNRMKGAVNKISAMLTVMRHSLQTNSGELEQDVQSGEFAKTDFSFVLGRRHTRRTYKSLATLNHVYECSRDLAQFDDNDFTY